MYSNSASVWPPWISWYAAPDPSYVHSFYACTARAPSQQKVLPHMVAYVMRFLNTCILGLASVCVHFSLSLSCISPDSPFLGPRSISSAVLLAYDRLALDIRNICSILLMISTYYAAFAPSSPPPPHTHNTTIFTEHLVRVSSWCMISLTYAVLSTNLCASGLCAKMISSTRSASHIVLRLPTASQIYTL